MHKPYYSVETLSPHNSIGYLMKRMHRAMHSLIEQDFKTIDLSFTQWAAMSLLKAGVADTCSALAREVGHDAGAMTRIIDQLAQRGFIRREADANDRRVTKLSVTKEGMDMLLHAAPKVVDIWNVALEDFSSDDVDRFVAMLKTMERKLVQIEGERMEQQYAQ